MVKNSFILETIYHRLYQAFGPQHWWSSRTKLEIIVGAILTQNTNWGNVKKAIANLHAQHLLSATALRTISTSRLAACVRPAGYFNVKARRLKCFIDFLFQEYGGSLKKMEKEPLADLRRKLLAVHGIGPETADSILLYAFDKPSFVVDAYTKRFLYRHGLAAHEEDYHAVQKMFTDHLPPDTEKFNEYHALIVRLGKEFCRPTPRCELCPLKDVHYSLLRKCVECHRVLNSSRHCVNCPAS